eukprot:SAG31_NODE_3651_length_4025_cov_3.433520_5_plen_47_part_00
MEKSGWYLSKLESNRQGELCGDEQMASLSWSLSARPVAIATLCDAM